MKRVFATITLLLLAGCASIWEKPQTGKKPIVLVSLAPYQRMVEQIAGDSVTVRAAVPADVDPHNWEPTYQDTSRLQGATLWFTIGEEFEPRLSSKLLDNDKSLIIHDISDQVDTLEDPYRSMSDSHHGHDHGSDHHHSHSHNGKDTHLWLDPILDIKQAQFITQTLITSFPEHRKLYEHNLDILTKKLLILNENIEEVIGPYKGMILVTTHGAYTYYCHQYNLQQLVIEPSGGKETRTKDLAKTYSAIERKKKKIIGIFLQPQQTNKAAQLIARKFGIQEHFVDPYQPDYIKTIENLTKAIISDKPGDGSISKPSKDDGNRLTVSNSEDTNE